MENRIAYALMAALLFISGYGLRAYTHTCPVAEPKVVTEYRDVVKTEVAYVPKETVIYKMADGSTRTVAEKTDVDIKINKPVLNVKVNNKDFAIQKADDEEYIFDKNKMSLTQTSSADILISVPTIDKTKRWQIGVGVSKNGAVGLVGFPVGKNMGGWVAGNEDDLMGGLTFRF